MMPEALQSDGVLSISKHGSSAGYDNSSDATSLLISAKKADVLFAWRGLSVCYAVLNKHAANSSAPHFPCSPFRALHCREATSTCENCWIRILITA